MAANAKKGRPSKAEADRRRRLEEAARKEKTRQQHAALIFLVLGLFLSALAFIEGQFFWTTMHDAIFGVFGVLAYAAGVLFLYLAYLFALGKTPPGPKMFKALFLTLAISGAIAVFGNQSATGDFARDVEVLYEQGMQKTGGGALSVIFGWTLQVIGGADAAKIMSAIVLMIAVMLITGKTVLDLINGANTSIEKIKERKRAGMEERARAQAPVPAGGENREKAWGIDVALEESEPVRSPIDIPLDGADGTEARVPKRPLAGQKRSPIDVPLGPDYQPKSAIDIDIDVPVFSKKGTGPAADVVDFVFEKEKKFRDTFERFDTRPAEEDLLRRTPFGKHAADADETREQTAKRAYRRPSLSLLEKPRAAQRRDVSAELRDNAKLLVDVLESFNVRARVMDASRGPTVTRYELQPETGVRLSRIVSLAEDLSLKMAAPVRIEAPIPGKAAVGIEVPNKQTQVVGLRSVLESEAFSASASPLSIAMGMDISGEIVVEDISKMPHLLIAGSTGMGKSVFINSMIVSLVFKSSPDDLRLVLIDPKMVEFTNYKGLPHLEVPVVTDPAKAAGALGTALAEMLRRYHTFSHYGVRNIGEYNAMVLRDYADRRNRQDEEEEIPECKPRMVVIIDELADLMMTAPREVENAIARIAQMGRAAGIHLVVATQRPSVDVITGTIKNNIPTRVAFCVSTHIDSRTILDGSGAEKLIGRGDMLFQSVGKVKPIRIQGCFVSDEEIGRVVEHLKKNSAAQYNEEFMREIEENAAREKGDVSLSDGSDAMLDAAIEVVVEAGNASTSMLQRRLKLGYARAARLIDEMEQKGIVGAAEGSKPRAVNMTRQQWQEMTLSRKDRTK